MSQREVSDLLLVAEAREFARSGEGARLRQATGLTLREVAAACGVSPAGLLLWERGDRRPRGAAAIRWVKVLRGLRQLALARQQEPVAK